MIKEISGPENWEEWEKDEKENLDKIGQLRLEGHTHHCACRLVWGDGECECQVRTEDLDD